MMAGSLVEFKGLVMSVTRANVAQMLLDGMTYSQVAKCLGVDRACVTRAASSLRERGLELPRQRRVVICAQPVDGGEVIRFNGKKDVERRGGFSYVYSHYVASRNMVSNGYRWWIER